MSTGNKLIVVLVNGREQALYIKKLIKTVVEEVGIYITGSADMAYKIVQKEPVALIIAELADKEKEKSSVEQMILRMRNHNLTRFLPVILLHRTDEYRIRALCDWNCIGYYTYPFDETGFAEKVKKTVLSVLPDEYDNSFVIRRHNVHYPIRVKELVYVKYFERALHLYMSTGDVLIVDQRPVQMIIELARARCIVRCGRGMLVNLMHVEAMDFGTKEIRLTNGEKLKIGETYERELKESQIGIDEIIKQNENELNIM